jgi:hypothetical protein
VSVNSGGADVRVGVEMKIVGVSLEVGWGCCVAIRVDVDIAGVRVAEGCSDVAPLRLTGVGVSSVGSGKRSNDEHPMSANKINAKIIAFRNSSILATIPDPVSVETVDGYFTRYEKASMSSIGEGGEALGQMISTDGIPYSTLQSIASPGVL